MEAFFGHLYIPMPKGTLFRDNFYVNNGKLYTSHYAGLGVSSSVISKHELLQQSTKSDTIQVLNILQASSALARVFCSIWQRFDRQFKDQNKLKDIWPITVANNQHDFASNETTKRIILRSEENIKQTNLIIEEAQENFRIFRVALSEDLTHLSSYLKLLKRNEKFCLEFNLASPSSLKKICEKELSEIRNLERDHSILSELESHYDFQARSKYLREPEANFARATIDSLCAIRAMEIFFQKNRNDNDQDRFSLRLFQGAPTFRGTITDQEIAYVNTTPWQPGIMGSLHVHRLKEVPEAYWKKIRRKFEKEVDSMNPVTSKFSDAIPLLENAAIEAVHEARTRGDEGKAYLEDLKTAIDSVRMVNEEDIEKSFQKLQDIRNYTRNLFRKVFYGLDEKISESIIIASNQSGIKLQINDKPVESLSQLFNRLEEIISIIKTMQNQPKYNFSNVEKVQIIEQVKNYIEQIQTYNENNNTVDPDIKQALEDLKQMIANLQQKHPQVSEEQATEILKTEFEEIKDTQSERWQNLLSLKRLWNGMKKGSLKVGEHFAEETPWGKGVIGFFEGVTDEIE
jgi:hypothetical protein